MQSNEPKLKNEIKEEWKASKIHGQVSIFNKHDHGISDEYSGGICMQYEVHWEHKQTKEYNIHGKYATFDEAIKSIYAWWELNEFEPTYVRMWSKGGRTVVDYGSHHMFYYIYECE